MSKPEPSSGPNEELIFEPEQTQNISSTELAGAGTGALSEGSAPDGSPVFKELASVELPPLAKENRARLQMQSPNRLYFYWSLKHNPFQTLTRLFAGDTGTYTLVVKLIDLTHDREELHYVESEGSWWFNVDANCEYRAEIGFYAPNRPFIRVLHSNTVMTPRKRPSPRPAEDADWTVTSDTFARVLHVSGFSQDAFDVAVAGDDESGSEDLTHAAFAKFIGVPSADFSGIASDELRHALFLIASGVALDTLRWKIDASLFAVLQKYADRLVVENALSALREGFGVEGDEIEEEASAAVFGASIINMPRRLRKKLRPRHFGPVSSFVNIRR